MKGKTTRLIIVANRVTAKVLEQEGPKRELQLIKEISNSAGRVKNQDLQADRWGRATYPSRIVYNRSGDHSSPSTGMKKDPKEVELNKFCKRIGAYVEKALPRLNVDKVLIVAEPHVLGTIKKALPEGIVSQLLPSIKKNMADLSVEKIADWLFKGKRSARARLNTRTTV